MIKSSQIFHCIGKNLPSSAELHDFVWDESEGAFEFRSEGVLCKFQMRLLERSGGRKEIDPSVAIRFDEVEQVFHRTSGFRPEFQKDSPTIGCSISRLSADLDVPSLIVASEADLDGAVQELGRLVQSIALPYFSRFSNLKAVDLILNENPDKPTPHRVHGWLRAASGLIVASLVGRETNSLVDHYRETLTRLDRGFYLQRFEDLVRDLQV